MKKILNSSFRDPSGVLFTKDGKLYRQINKVYKQNYDFLYKSGLYKNLSKNKLLIQHKKAPNTAALNKTVYKVITPQVIDFISYPYEWSFSQLKDAALLTLKIQRISLEHGMSLKDASAYNIQFTNCKPIFIDTLSFEKYKEGKPWIAYKQFCQHFLAPLVLMAYTDVRLSILLKDYIDGIPLDLVSRLLPLRTYLSLPILSHIYLHARSQKYFGDKKVTKIGKEITKANLMGIISNLESLINNLNMKIKNSDWSRYYENTNYSRAALTRKKKIVKEMLLMTKARKAWDLGANTGVFSLIAAKLGVKIIAFDSDQYVIESLYKNCRGNKYENILPLVADFTNPSPSIGWSNQERLSFVERGPVDVVLALALVHHLAILNNLPLSSLAGFFGKVSTYLIIEFIPKNDVQVQRLLRNREDLFSDYTKANFEKEFGKYFRIRLTKKISGTNRLLYLMLKT